MKRFIAFVVVFIAIFFFENKIIHAATGCTYNCGACYQGMQLCTSGSFYSSCTAPLPYSCPPYSTTVVWCYDYQQACTGVNTPTVILNQCGPGYFGCNKNSQPGFCCPVGGSTPTPNPVNTSPPGNPTCSPQCGGAYCGWKDDTCGHNCACNECETCTLKCGQAMNCGGTCANTDNGVAPAMTIVSPAGSLANPTLTTDSTPTLTWTALAAGGLTDRYFLELMNSGGTVVWSTYINTLATTSISSGVALTAGSVYSWHIRAENTTCGTDVGAWSASGYVKLNSPPTVTCVLTKNSNGTTVAWETGNKNHIMNPSFVGTALPRRVIFQVCVNDVDGFADINSAKMQWNGATYAMTLGAGSGTGVTATVTVDFAAASNGTAALPISFDTKDTLTAANPLSWVASGYSFKVWDGSVAVSGNMYDSSDSPLGAQCPSGQGYTTLASAAMNFKYADFTPTVGSLVRVNKISDSAYSGGVLTWGKTYAAVPNVDLVGSAVTTARWINMGVGTTSCGSQLTINSTLADPYNASPAVKTDFASASGQPGWYQVSGGGIQSAGTISNIIPTTCGLDATCVSSMVKTNNSMVSAASINNSGCVLGSANCQYGNPNNWYKQAVTLSSAEKYDYRYFYDKYFLGYGGGVTLPANSTMTTVKGLGVNGIYFVDGDFNVNENNVLAAGEALVIIAKGKISFATTATSSEGVFIADGGMSATGSAAGGLVINGLIYSASSAGHITFTREYANPIDNNNKPAVLVNYQPDLIFNLPGALLKVLSGWRQN